MDTNSYINSEKQEVEKVEIKQIIAMWYLFLLPWHMITQLSFINALLGACANFLSFLFHIIGLLLMFYDRKGKLRIEHDAHSKLFHYFIFMVANFILISIGMAFYLHDKVGTIGGEDTYRAILGQIIYFIQYIFIILYNREVFRILKKDKIIDIFHKITWVLLVIGYVQILLIEVGGIFVRLYDSLNLFDNVWPSYLIILIERITLTGSEPAAAGVYISILILPFLLAKCLYYGNTLKNILPILLYLPIIYYTKSSTAYVLALVCILIYFMLYIKKTKDKRKVSLLIIAVALIVVFTLPYYESIKNTEFMEDIRYIVIDKVTNQTNRDTISRKIPLYVNYRIFLEYPILGVGNGNQGFFYLSNLPPWAYSSYDIALLITKASQTLSNGSLFFPSILSGYGIIGAIMMIVYIGKLYAITFINKSNLGMFFYMFIISSVVVIISGFTSEFVGNYMIWFILSIPYIKTLKE